jgi:acylphosphatase
VTYSPVERITRRFRITGKVQGVYFRQSTRKEAERLAILGVARNLSDGSVEVIAHGSGDAVDTLRQWLERGPAMARVDSVEELESQRRADTAAREPLWKSFSVE